MAFLHNFLKLLLCYPYVSLTYSIATLEKPFVAVWNAPSAVCEDNFDVEINLTMFDIVSNTGQNFSGNDMVIFYEPLPGFYPFISPNGTFVNGGLPQIVDLAKHFNKSKADILTKVKGASFDGLVVIDWESWRPIFRRNLYSKTQHVYIDQSVSRIQRKHQSWNKTKVYNMAKAQFESSARTLMEGTLLFGRQLRRTGYWGFYGFPACYNHQFGQRYCSYDTVFYNDRLSWMFSASSALYPSIYLDDTIPSVIDRKYRVEGILRESLRVQGLYSDPYTPIYAYSRYRYRQSENFYNKIAEQVSIIGDTKSQCETSPEVTKTAKGDDLINTVGQSFDAGMDGIVIWEGEKFFKNRSDCLSLKKYLENLLGPIVKQTTEFARSCSVNLCNGHGKCSSKKWHKHKSWVYDLSSRNNIADYKCNCYKNWTGEHCNKRQI